MEDRRRIVVPIGSEPETPHFDAEETLLSARPVVPIAPAVAAEGFNNSQSLPRTPFYRRSAFLALVVISAVGIGLAAGLSIARYHYQPEDARTTAVAQPAQVPSAASDKRTATIQPPEDQQSQATALPEVKIEEKTTVGDTSAEDNEKADAPEPTTKVSTKAPESSKEKSSDDRDDNVKITKPEPRDKKRASDDDDESYTDAPRAQRRERRGRNRDRDEDTVDIPRRIERAGERINRIREIFEGSQQQRP